MENKQETTGKKFYESADAVITVSKQLTDLEIAIKLEEIEREENQAVLLYSCERALEERNEQIKRMYNEEEVLNILYKHTEDLLAGKKITLEQWFEQYKKK
jgi:HJR/Mrr/RecB family endonuclease